MKQRHDKTFSEYQYEQSVLLRLTSQYTGNVPLVQNQRAFFDNRSVIKGKRIIGISLPNTPTVPQWNYEDVLIVPATGYSVFALTLVDIHGNVIVSNYPLTDLCDINNKGNTRKFNCEISFKSSYVMLLSNTVAAANTAILFNFFTTD
jgi:hypothetical protein